jgi:hypothetical protein
MTPERRVELLHQEYFGLKVLINEIHPDYGWGTNNESRYGTNVWWKNHFANAVGSAKRNEHIHPGI